ncbi:pyridoxal phosphate-dependent transferase [Colletotrichum phormii]|uniref:Pyridoxal phosphate-dependent transferase n=1 Tax=Colletotrichum phormii TaxID=359342 RepID=A0AAJ0EJD4_9PEZI|nr:pyridoxal phosphate-dependent transferase [Colletotrichum phormii]KAK1640914.1 pyridoxal phosphate-dependent transferase [Colletotrichum phormii]
MDSSEFRTAAAEAIDDITKYYDTITSQPKVLPSVTPGYLRPLLPESAPEDPESWQSIHADLQSHIVPGITHWQSPSFHAFFPCSSSYPAMLAELYSNAFNGAHFNWICSPAVTELETIVLDWLAQLLNLPAAYLSTAPTRGGGVLHGTASEAILTVMVAARDKFLRARTAHLPADSEEKEEETWRLRSKLVALGSEMAHSSTKKAAQILGVRFATVPAPAETGYAMSGPALASTVAALRAKGLEPFYLTATLGTTDTCAVDDFPGIKDALLASDEQDDSIWVHVDAAYAGSALMLPQNAHLTSPFTAFHSFNVNPHKWMLTNFDCSALWVRDRAWLVESLSIKPAYLRNQFSEAGLVTDYRDWQIPLGRRFRSLKLWFVLRAYGASGIRKHLERGIRLGERFAEMVAGRGDLFEIVTGPRYALVVFTCKAKAGGNRERSNKVTEAVLESVNGEGVIYLTPTTLHGLYGIRMCTGSSQVIEEEHVKKAFDIIVAATEKALAEGQ